MAAAELTASSVVVAAAELTASSAVVGPPRLNWDKVEATAESAPPEPSSVVVAAATACSEPPPRTTFGASTLPTGGCAILSSVMPCGSACGSGSFNPSSSLSHSPLVSSL